MKEVDRRNSWSPEDPAPIQLIEYDTAPEYCETELLYSEILNYLIDHKYCHTPKQAKFPNPHEARHQEMRIPALLVERLLTPSEAATTFGPEIRYEVWRKERCVFRAKGKAFTWSLWRFYGVETN